MIAVLLITSVSLGTIQAPLNSGAQATLDSLTEARRQSGYGPAAIIAAASADLSGNGRADVAAVYHYRIGAAQDRSGTQWIVLLLATDSTEHAAVGPWMIGGKGSRLVETLIVHGDTLEIRGHQYLVGDSQCCPGGAFEQRLLVVDRRLREISGSWRRRGPPH